MTMDSFSSLNVFVHAAEQRSFTAAGRILGISASAVGKSIARQEARLGVRLFQRSTRRISLTAEGALFLERCQRILIDLSDAEEELARSRLHPAGTLRVSLPAIGYRILMPILPGFIERYPEILPDIDFSDRMVDIVEEGFDVVIRSGNLTDSRLKARPLGPFRFRILASPDYLARYGTPVNAQELARHHCLRYKFPASGKLQPWILTEGDDPAPATASIVCNNIEGLIEAALGGLGLAWLPDFFVREECASGHLVSVLEDQISSSGQFNVVWPSSRHLSPKIRVFVDYLCAHTLENFTTKV